MQCLYSVGTMYSNVCITSSIDGVNIVLSAIVMMRRMSTECRMASVGNIRS